MTKTSKFLNRRKTIVSVKGKGGVNGSHNVMATATLLRLAGADTVLFDLDGSTGTTITKMGERDAQGLLKDEQSMTGGVAAINMFDPDERTNLFDIVETDDRFLLLDGPAASIGLFGNLGQNVDAKEWVAHNKACDRDLVVMVPITPFLASIVNVAQAIETFGTDVDYVVVRSMRGCRPRDYVLWDEPEFRNHYGNLVGGRSRAMLEAVRGTVLDMPALDAGTLARAEAMQVTFAEAITTEHLRSYERLSMMRWLKAWSEQLDLIRGPLGLAPDFVWNVA